MTIRDNDLILISQVKLFDSHKAFEKIVIKYQSKIRRLFLNLTLRNKDLTYDLAQETFIKVYLNIHSFKAASRFSTWVYRIAYNTFLDYKRVNHRQFVNILPEDDINFAYHDEINTDHELNHILHVLKTEEREVIVLSYIEELSHKEISEVINMPIGTVKTHIKRGREKLVEYLKITDYENKR